jgi:hypothetical protein
MFRYAPIKYVEPAVYICNRSGSWNLGGDLVDLL